MASEEVRKKWGTIFMGEREASVEQLNAMQEHVNRDKLQKEQTEDYMERVKARAVERAREILGAAYTERQKVLEEAKGEAAVQKRLAAQECIKIKGEGEEIRKQAQEELQKAQAEREEAEKIRASAHNEGYQEGLNQAGAELHEFRAEMGQALARLLRSLERERRNILEAWREDLADLVRAAAQAGTGLILQKEHDQILRQLVFQALDLLENKNAISLRVNPRDEENVSDMFRAARERAPELRQWTVTGDEAIEPGGLVAESGTGSVDYRRANFRETVDSVLCHLGLPEQPGDASHAQEVASLVEQEVAHIASMTPELEMPPPEAPEPEVVAAEAEAAQEVAEAAPAAEPEPEQRPEQPPLESISPELAEMEEELDLGAPEEEEPEEIAPEPDAQPGQEESLADLEDELFPLEGETQESESAESELERRTLAEGGFL